jgi:hypothetical protein
MNLKNQNNLQLEHNKYIYIETNIIYILYIYIITYLHILVS